MSEQNAQAPIPPWVGRKGFITEREWASFDPLTQGLWMKFAQDIGWLLEQPQFRRSVFTFLNDARFCGTEHSPVRATPELTYQAIGVQDAGRALRLVLQSVAPRMWMKTMHEAFNATKE